MNIVNILVSRGFVSFNPFTLELRNHQYAVSTEDSLSWNVDEKPPMEIIQMIIDMSHSYFDKLKIDGDYKYNFYWDLLAFDSTYDLTSDICFDDEMEALKFANEYELYNVANLFDDDEDDYLSDTEEEV